MPSKHQQRTEPCRSKLLAIAATLAFALFAFPTAGHSQNITSSGTESIAVAQAFATQRASEDRSIRPFKVQVPQAALDDLRRRINATRWPDKETVDDRSQGTQLAKLQELVRYWGTDYDWRKVEAKLNSLPQFVTTIDGLDIHFIHVRSRHPNALPVIITHGWPGSVTEQLKVIGPLTDPTTQGGRAQDAFDVVIPSMPGYGFSGRPTATGWNPDRIARAWAELMSRLGYTHYVAQGGDWGSPVSSAMARQAPPGLLGIHINLPATVPADVATVLASGGPAPTGLSEEERAAFASLDAFYKMRRAYAAMMGTRPQVIGQALTDSPAGLAAFMFDYNNGEPERLVPRDDFLDNVTLYWLTNTATSSARLYWETSRPERSSRGRTEDIRDRAAGGHHGVSGRGLSSPADMGAARLSQLDLLQASRQGRPLRRVGAARALCERTPCRLQITQAGSLITILILADPKELHMKTTRIMALAVLIGGSGLALHVTQAQQSGITRADVVRHDLGVPGREVIQVRVDFAPGVAFPYHSHPGVEVAYVLEGTLEYQFEGKPPVTLKAGEALFIPAGVNHTARNAGTGKASELATYIVEKGQPLVVLAK